MTPKRALVMLAVLSALLATLAAIVTTWTVPHVSAAIAPLSPVGAAPRQAANDTWLLTSTVTPTPTNTPICPGSWTQQAPYPIAISDNAVASLGNFLYSFGGYDGIIAIATSYKYDPGSNSWSAIAPLPAEREAARAVSDGTYIYILGGWNGVGQVMSTLYRYDPSLDSYITLASLTTRVAAPGIAYLNGKIYRIGGCGIDYTCGMISSVEAYTISSNTWAPAAALPQTEAWVMATGLGGFVYAAGGIVDNDTATNKTYRYDPIANSWNDAAIPDLPDNTRWAGASDVLKTKWVLAGGVLANRNTVTNTALAYDPNTNSWSLIDPMLQPGYRMTGGAGGTGYGAQFYVVGGTVGIFEPTTSNQRYIDICQPTDTPTSTFTPTNMPTDTGTPTPTVTGTPPTATRTFTPLPTLTTTCCLYVQATGTATCVALDAYHYDYTVSHQCPRYLCGQITFYFQASPDSNPNGTWTTLDQAQGHNWCAGPLVDEYTGTFNEPAIPGQYSYWRMRGTIWYQDCRGGHSWNVDTTPAPLCRSQTPIPSTLTYTPTLTPTPTNTLTNTPSNTPTNTRTDTPTNTPRPPTLTSTPTMVPTNTNTDTPTATPTTQPTATSTVTSTAPPTATASSTSQRTQTPGGTATPPTATATACPMGFSDVRPEDYFYEPVGYLYCHGAISGYENGTFRPYNLTTRGQLAKIIVLAVGWLIYTPPTPTFRDVPLTGTFYAYVETAYSHGIISGYNCGTDCLEYRPGSNVTRAQLCKIVVLARSWLIYTPPTPTFRDVPSTDAFYAYVETAHSHGIISGYNCGTGCLEFRPGNNATRGQICKITYLAITNP